MDDSWWAQKLGRVQTAPQPGPAYSYAPAQAPYAESPAVQNGPAPVWVEDPNVEGGRRFNWRAWGGGEAARTQRERCPQCGSANYFHFHNEAKVTPNGMATPAPQCFECNYRGGLYQPFGGR